MKIKYSGNIAFIIKKKKKNMCFENWEFQQKLKGKKKYWVIIQIQVPAVSKVVARPGANHLTCLGLSLPYCRFIRYECLFEFMSYQNFLP